VANETGADGSAIRIVSGRHDLTAGGTRLGAADSGVQVGDSRCTRNVQLDNRRSEVRTGLLLCWRASATRSVVTVATIRGGRPIESTSARVIDRIWRQLG
jgi:hypothetical protein